jgi:hypothetical protein
MNNLPPHLNNSPGLVHAESSLIPLYIADSDPASIDYIKDCLTASLSPYEGVLFFRQERTRYYLLISAIKYPAPIAATLQKTRAFQEAGWIPSSPCSDAPQGEECPAPSEGEEAPSDLAIKSRNPEN